MADMLEMADEVQDALGRSYGMPDIDEDELAAELDALGDEIALDNDTSYLDDIKTPSAPSREPGADSVVNKVRKLFCFEKNVGRFPFEFLYLKLYGSLYLSNICYFYYFAICFRMAWKLMNSDCLNCQPRNNVICVVHKILMCLTAEVSH